MTIRLRLRMMLLLRISAVLTLVALALMCWAVLEPTPLPTIIAMSVGQVFGTLAFLMYATAIVIDLRRDARARRRLIDNGEQVQDHPPATPVPAVEVAAAPPAPPAAIEDPAAPPEEPHA
jgi:hypothetical protein